VASVSAETRRSRAQRRAHQRRGAARAFPLLSDRETGATRTIELETKPGWNEFVLGWSNRRARQVNFSPARIQ